MDNIKFKDIYLTVRYLSTKNKKKDNRINAFNSNIVEKIEDIKINSTIITLFKFLFFLLSIILPLIFSYFLHYYYIFYFAQSFSQGLLMHLICWFLWYSCLLVLSFIGYEILYSLISIMILYKIKI